MTRGVGLNRRTFALTLLGSAIALLSVVVNALLLLDPGPPRWSPRASELAARPAPVWQPRVRVVHTWSLDRAWLPWQQGRPSSALLEPTRAGLQLGLDTQGSDPALVHGVGVVAREPLAPGARVSALLDWRPTDNDSYRRAGVLLCAQPPAGRALADLDAAVWLEVVGVPPGRRARLYGGSREQGRERAIFRDGWPQDRRGRAIRRIALELELDGDQVVLRAEGRELARAEHPFGDAPVWLLCYTTSHSNYPARPVTFLELAVEAPLGATAEPQ